MNPEILEKLLGYITDQRRLAVAQTELLLLRRLSRDTTIAHERVLDAAKCVALAETEIRDRNRRLQGDGK